MMVIGLINRISIDYIDMTYIPKWLGTLNTFRTKYYYQIIELSPQIEALNVEFRTA